MSVIKRLVLVLWPGFETIVLDKYFATRRQGDGLVEEADAECRVHVPGFEEWGDERLEKVRTVAGGESFKSSGKGAGDIDVRGLNGCGRGFVCPI